MLNLIFFIPLITVIAAAAAYRLVSRRKSFGPVGWLILTISLLVAAILPLGCGVWLPDIFGKQSILCSATASTGHRISIVQYWNHVDFYTTEARLTSPDGATSVTLLDGDASKSWSGTLEIDPPQKSAAFRLLEGRTGVISW